MINWAHANEMHQPVAAWLEACSQWDVAVATQEYHHQKKRRKLCKDHNISCPRTIDANDNLDVALDYIRKELMRRIQQIHATKNTFTASGMLQSRSSSTQQKPQNAPEPTKSQSKADQKDLSQYFTRVIGSDVSAGSAAAASSYAVVTDVGSAFLRLRVKQHQHTDDSDFHIVKNALDLLRNPINKKDLRKMVTDKRKNAKTVRQHFQDRCFRTVHFVSPQSSTETGSAKQIHFNQTHYWTTYYVKLLVLAQARRWLSATERLDAVEESPPTPKTIFQLSAAIKQPPTAEHLPFGCDFEDPDAYSPTIRRLLAYAEIHN